MAQKSRSGSRSGKAGKPAARPASSDFKVRLDKPAPSPLDFVNRRMAEKDGDKSKP